MKMKGFYRSIGFLVLIFIINEIRAKPVQNEDVESNAEVTKNVLDLEKENKIERKRVGRQNVRILMDPADYDEIEQSVRKGISKVPIVVAEPIKPPPKKYRPRGMFGFVTSLLGGSSGNDVRASDAYIRVRRQVEKLVDKMKRGMNQTKSQKQEIEEDEDGGEEKTPEDSTEKSSENDNSNSDEDEDEPPGGGDGMGGGILGILNGLSGEGGQSDLGTLLTTLGSIVGNLSGGPGFDLNSLISSAVALIGGILGGNGMKPIGVAIGTYVNTALEGITGGGAMNNGQFFGDLIATVLGGISEAAGDEDAEDSDEGDTYNGSDSGTFFMSLLSSLFGAMSKST